MNTQEKTLGEKRIRTTFNPSENDKVSKLKNIFAELIDIIDEIDPEDGEQARLKAISLTELETSAMYAVKTATYKAETTNQ